MISSPSLEPKNGKYAIWLTDYKLFCSLVKIKDKKHFHNMQEVLGYLLVEVERVRIYQEVLRELPQALRAEPDAPSHQSGAEE